MVNALIIFSFIAGVCTGVYCLRLGMMWAERKPEEKPNFIMPTMKKPPPEPEQTDKTLEHWFEGEKQ